MFIKIIVVVLLTLVASNSYAQHKFSLEINKSCSNTECTKVVTDLLDKAKLSIIINYYKFDNQDINKAIYRAVARNINILVVINRGQALPFMEVLKYYESEGSSIYVDPSLDSIVNNKIFIIDQFITIKGNINNNINFLQLYRNTTIANIYINECLMHTRHSNKLSVFRSSVY